MKLYVTKHFPYMVCIVIIALLGLLDIFGSIHTESLLLLGFLTVLYVMKYYGYHDNSLNTIVILMLSFFLYVLVYQFSGISSAGYARVAIYLCWMIVGLTGVIIYKFFTRKERIYLFYTIYFLTMLGTIHVAINGYSFVSKGLFMPTSETATVHGTMIMLFGGICLLWFLNDKNFLNKTLAVMGVLLSILVSVFIMQRGITLVLSTLMYSGILLFNGKRSQKVFYIIGLLLMILVFLYYSDMYLTLLDCIADFVPSERLSKRILQIKNFFLLGAEAKETHGFSGRLPLMLTSINTWTSSIFSFFLGVGDHRGNNLIIGNHSEFLDSLARFGLVGAGLLWSIVYQQYRIFVNKNLKVTNYTCFIQATIIFLVFVLRGLMGNVLNFKVGIQMCIFLPLVLDMLMNTSVKGVDVNSNEVDKNPG